MNSFEFLKKWVAESCPYGVQHYCDGTVNKSIKGHKDRKPLKECPQRKNGKCVLLAQVQHKKNKE